MNDFQAKLHERLDECVYWYQSAWEHDPNMQIVNNSITGRDPALEDHESRMIKLFGGLRDSVDAIPAPVLAGIEDRRGILGNEKFEAIFELAIEAVGRQSFPVSATDFAETLILNLQFATADASGRQST